MASSRAATGDPDIFSGNEVTVVDAVSLVVAATSVDVGGILVVVVSMVEVVERHAGAVASLHKLGMWRDGVRGDGCRLTSPNPILGDPSSTYPLSASAFLSPNHLGPLGIHHPHPPARSKDESNSLCFVSHMI